MICLTLIARDEARCLERCLNSAAPFVDDMLVVDTGSVDATRDIAAACGARVAAFPWCDDFSAARNFALAQTSADWRLVLDADEWIEAGGDSLRPLAAAASVPFVGQVGVRSAFDDGDAVRHAITWISRFLPRGVAYEGRIHEQPVHELPVRRLALTIGHDGYRRAQRERKGDRNERLLQSVVQERPQDAYARYQQGKDREIHGGFAAACAAYAHARDLLHWPPADPVAAVALRARHAWLHDLAVRTLHCLKETGQFERAHALIRAERALWQQSPDFHFAVGSLLLDQAIADPGQAPRLLPMIESAWMTCLELGEAPHLEGAVAGRGSTLAAHNLALLHGMLGDTARAAHFRTLAAAPPA